MKITAIQTSNFLGAHNVDVKLTKPVALFAGKNGAGKSSLQEAVRMALTGESVRVSLKKEYAALISEGADVGYAVVDYDGGNRAAITLPNGAHELTAGSVPGALAMVLDAQRFAHLAANDRRAFLFGLMGLKTDGPAVTERLLARKCDVDKVAIIAPYLRAGFEAAQKEAATKAREFKAMWKAVTGGETYGSVKAAAWKAAFPEGLPEGVISACEKALLAVECELENKNRYLGTLQSNASAQAGRAEKLAALRETAGKFARIQDKLNKDEAELKEWEGKVATLRGSVKSQDAIACPDCGVMLVMKDGDLVHAAPMAKGTEDDLANLPEYENALRLFQNAVANGKRDLAAADAAAQTITQLESESFGEVNENILHVTKAGLESLKKDRAGCQTRLEEARSAQRKIDAAEDKTKEAANCHANVQQWEAIADALAPDGIPGEMLAEALGPINARLAESAQMAEWGQIIISSGMEITCLWNGGEESRDYTLLSESEKWRADAMIAEAVSHLSGVDLLVLDRFDVLDMKGREDLLYWLDALAEDGQIDTALIFGTLKGLPAAFSDQVEAFWIEDGQIGRLKEAA